MVERQLVDSNEVLAAVLDGLHEAISEAGAAITCEPLPRVRTCPTQLAQVLQNLIANALKYRRKGVAPEVRISAEDNETETVFSIADNGIGIAREHWDRVFLIFKRLHRSGDYKGEGVGLALAKRLVERHGGRIWLESEPGSGSTFRFSIPRVTAGMNGRNFEE